MNPIYRHQVIFSLKSGASGPQTEAFLADARRILSAIPGVTNFQVLKQVSAKNDFDFGFSMDFQDLVAYQRYNDHADHTTFVRDRWIPEVSRFLEIDLQEHR